VQGEIPSLEARFSLTAEQLEASRAERMRQNGLGAVTIEDARTWLEETGLCLFLPRRQFSTFIAPSFVEAVAGDRNSAPAAKTIQLAEELLIRLETEGVAVRLNLLGQAGEQPDFIVAGWVLPYVYALRGDRDWRRNPQLTGSRQVSPLAVQAYKQLEAGDATISQLRHALGREVSESAVLRAITELWQQLRIIPAVSAPGKPAQWQLLRLRFQKAIAEGASTSQVTAISVLASIYLQAVIAASMEEVELFLAPLTARSKVREVLRGLVATRQVHSVSMGHAPHFYVAGTLPDFAPAPTAYSSSSMPASAYFLRSYEREDVQREPASPAPVSVTPSFQAGSGKSVDSPLAPRTVEPAAEINPVGSRPQLSRPSSHSNGHKPNQNSSSSRAARRPARNARGPVARSSGARTNGSSLRAHSSRWTKSTANNGAARSPKSSSGSSRFHANGNGHAAAPAPRKSNSAAARASRNGHGSPAKGAKPVSRRAAAPRAEVRADKRNVRGTRKPALAASAKAGNRGRYGFTASSRQRSKKRG
jgi:hypothetical protein